MEREEFYTEQEMAELLGYKLSTMKKNRCMGTNHPPFMKLGGRIVYPKEDYRKWVQGLTKQSACH